MSKFRQSTNRFKLHSDMSNKICHRKRTSNNYKSSNSLVLCRFLYRAKLTILKSKLIQVQINSKIIWSIQLYKHKRILDHRNKITNHLHKNPADLTGDLQQVNLQRQDLKLYSDYRQKHESIDITGLIKVAQLPKVPINLSYTRQRHITQAETISQTSSYHTSHGPCRL